MLTRLEADGFKNLVGFAADFGPCTCIAGPNGIGKSNVFDAIHFLSLLADRSILEAALHVRAGTGDTGRVEDLFLRGGRSTFRLAAEMLVDRKVRDDFARAGEAASTFLRYEIEIGQRTGRAERADPFVSDIELRSESLTFIRQGAAGRRLRFPHSKSRFRDRVVRNRRFARSGYISTEPGDGGPEIIIHQDGGARGPGPRAPARTAPKTIVGTTNSIATPTILAARREMQKWRLLALEPSAMRQPDRMRRDPPFVSDHGRHLASTLERLTRTGGSPDDDDVAARISARLAELVPVTGVEVLRDDVRKLLTLSITEVGGQRFPAGAVSDGTLRFLALAILAEDPEARGLLCIEEPENGVHPERLQAMTRLVKALAVDADDSPGDGNVMRQVIVATHSPYFLQLQDPADVLIAKEASLNDGRSALRALRCYPLADTWRSSADGRRALGPLMMREYLQPPDGVQLRMPFDTEPQPT